MLEQRFQSTTSRQFTVNLFNVFLNLKFQFIKIHKDGVVNRRDVRFPEQVIFYHVSEIKYIFLFENISAVSAKNGL